MLWLSFPCSNSGSMRCGRSGLNSIFRSRIMLYGVLEMEFMGPIPVTTQPEKWYIDNNKDVLCLLLLRKETGKKKDVKQEVYFSMHCPMNINLPSTSFKILLVKLANSACGYPAEDLKM
ncbi:hypothetical protein Tco_0226614 [Tanacetum coccineum]